MGRMVPFPALHTHWVGHSTAVATLVQLPPLQAGAEPIPARKGACERGRTRQEECERWDAPAYAKEAEGNDTFTVREGRGQLLDQARTCQQRHAERTHSERKLGSIAHSNTAFCRVDEVHLGNSATAVIMVRPFVRDSAAIGRCGRRKTPTPPQDQRAR